MLDGVVDEVGDQSFDEVLKWCDGGEAPAWVGILDLGDIPFSSDSPRSAIYRGVLCLTALAGARDLCTGENIALHECQDDHIFPSAVYGGSYPVDGVLNRAFIAKKCNNWKRARKPSEFFAHCLGGHGGDRAALLSTLSSHLISEGAVDSLLGDDFHAFRRLPGIRCEECDSATHRQRVNPGASLGAGTDFISTLHSLGRVAGHRSLARRS